MAKLRGSTLVLGFALAFTGLVAACSDDAADKLDRRTPGGPDGADGSVDPNNPNGGGPPPEEKLFRELEPDLQKKCGGVCHTDATYKPTPPAFLAPPDAYKSIKAHPGIVTRDVYASALLTKGPHAGPAVSADPEFEKKVVAWLEAEAIIIQSQQLPTTDPVTIKQGANTVDLTKACAGGLTGVSMTFDASLVGTILQLSNMKIVTQAGTDVHVLHPKFVKILGTPKEDGTVEVEDPADSFSNSDQTIAGGTTAILAPGSVLFTGDDWTPFDLAQDKLRIEFEKLEPGKVQATQETPECKDANAFAANVLPSMRGQAGGFNLNCASCHGNGLAGMSLNDGDKQLVCDQVLSKLNKADIAKSLIVTKVTVGPHSGGQITNKTGWTNLFVNNKAVFF